MLDKSNERQLVDWLRERTNDTVQTGPFKGMRLLCESNWAAEAFGPMLLGTHEQELHEIIEHEVGRLAGKANPRVVNVGCAEGYYAVGLARLLPSATVYAVDIDPEALRCTERLAALNGVEVVTDQPLEESLRDVDLVVMDCEGAEVGYLDLDKFPTLRKATVVVEIHLSPYSKLPSPHEIIGERWKHTHRIGMIFEGGRDPNRFEFLKDQHSVVRWMAVSENRPCRMHWFVMKPIRVCGDCTLCCALERVPEIKKPGGRLCEHCDAGCVIHEDRPKSCRDFECAWLASDMPEEWRPDLIGAYAAGNPANGVVRVCATDDAKADEMIASLGAKGLHVVVHRGRRIEFVASPNAPAPEKINVEWVL